jgi:hypothetical protein
MRRLILISICVLIAAAALPAKKKARGGNDNSQGYSQFRQEDVQEIQRYYRGRPAGLPPGLAKRDGDLPPGLAKKLRRDGQLPPGLQKRVEPFPEDLERRLPPLRPGFYRGLLGGRAVICNERSGTIVDITVIPGR